MKWNKPKDKLPEQGKKVLCMYWFQIPFCDSLLSFISAPDYWQEIDFARKDTGYLRMKVQDIAYRIDDFEKAHPNEYKLLVDNLLKIYDKTHPEGRYEP
jgi:hypothetical protein